MRRRSLLSPLLAGLAFCAAAAVGVYLWRGRKEPAPYVTQRVIRGDLAQVISATGVLQPVVLSPVGSQVSGIVWKIRADHNDRVKKGQVLLELDPALFQAAVARESANLQTAQAEVRKTQAAQRNAQLQAERARKLAEQRYISMAERDTAEAQARQAEADVASAEARVLQARAALQRAQLDLKNSVILSPVDGVVIARNVEVGQAVVASFQAPNLFTIAGDLTRMQVLANVDEADIGVVRVGQQASFTVDAHRGRRFHAKVSQVRNAAQTVQNVVTYVVVLDVDNEELALRPGMTANVRMDVARREDALLLPNAALRFRPRGEGRPPAREPGREDGPGREGGRGPKPSGGTRAVVYLPGGPQGLTPQPITVGITDGQNTEVLEGLSEGQDVIVDLVRPQAAPAPAGLPMAPLRGRNGGARRVGF